MISRWRQYRMFTPIHFYDGSVGCHGYLPDSQNKPEPRCSTEPAGISSIDAFICMVDWEIVSFRGLSTFPGSFFRGETEHEVRFGCICTEVDALFRVNTFYPKLPQGIFSGVCP